MNYFQKEKVSITRKIVVIFIAVIVIELFLFIISLSLTTSGLRRSVTHTILENYLSSATYVDDGENANVLHSLTSDEVESIIINANDMSWSASEGIKVFTEEENVISVIDLVKNINVGEKLNGELPVAAGTLYYSAVKTKNNIIIIGVSTGNFLNAEFFNMISFMIGIYALIFTLGGLIIAIWMYSLVKRINKLCEFVENMPANNYKEIYIDEGDDEILQLSIKIDDMRRTIIKDEKTKESMLQNISHDLKTPIAVIRSYAEAIGDGVEDISATDIIIDQSKKLEKKVKQLIEFNKLEYLTTEGKMEAVKMNQIITKIVNNCKHLSNLTFKTDLDGTIFFGKYENYFMVCENIIENAIRYAVSTIEVTLKEGVLKVYNDGKHIDEQFIQNGFKPYEKGSDGKFGLGMSIVCRTLDYFNMSLTAENNEVGVTFTSQAK